MQGGGDMAFGDPRELLKPETRASFPAEVLDTITGALSTSITLTFALAAIPAALALCVAFFMGRSKLDVSAIAEGEEGQHASH